MGWISVFVVLSLFFGQATDLSKRLFEAVKLGDITKVGSLLKSGAAVNAPDREGRTALHEAASRENVAIFKILVIAGGEISAKDHKGITPQYIVFNIANNEIRNEMIRAFPKGTQPQIPQRPWNFSTAISRRQPTVVEMLLQMGVNPNMPDQSGNLPLDLAAQKGDLPIVQLLLLHGADVNRRSHNGSFPIHTAAWGGHTEIVKSLLDQGADVNCRVSETGETPLFYAASFGRTKTVELLLERGAQAGITDSRGVTPLAAALKADQAEVVTLLRAREAAQRQERLTFEVVSIKPSQGRSGDTGVQPLPGGRT
jgi:ankyrin repeat protein